MRHNLILSILSSIFLLSNCNSKKEKYIEKAFLYNPSNYEFKDSTIIKAAFMMFVRYNFDNSYILINKNDTILTNPIFKNSKTGIKIKNIANYSDSVFIFKFNIVSLEDGAKLFYSDYTDKFTTSLMYNKNTGSFFPLFFSEASLSSYIPPLILSKNVKEQILIDDSKSFKDFVQFVNEYQHFLKEEILTYDIPFIIDTTNDFGRNIYQANKDIFYSYKRW
jgi:hypothetical protein